MSQTRVNYAKVIAPRPLGVEAVSGNRMDIFRFVMICTILFTMVSVFHVWSRFKLVDLNIEIADISARLKEAEQEQNRLKVEEALLKTPARIEKIARDNLRMLPPVAEQIIVVK